MKGAASEEVEFAAYETACRELERAIERGGAEEIEATLATLDECSRSLWQSEQSSLSLKVSPETRQRFGALARGIEKMLARATGAQQAIRAELEDLSRARCVLQELRPQSEDPRFVSQRV